MKAIIDPTLASLYGIRSSLAYCRPVLAIPTQEIGTILERLKKESHDSITDIIDINCRCAAYNFFEMKKLWRDGYGDRFLLWKTSVWKTNGMPFRGLPFRGFPQQACDFSLRDWIRKMQSTFSGNCVHTPLDVTLRDVGANDGYHFDDAMLILAMSGEDSRLDPLEFESSLCYAISWCKYLYAVECETRLKRLWYRLHPTQVDDGWKLDLSGTYPPNGQI